MTKASLDNHMATEVRLPQWSMGMDEGQVVMWHKQVGDVVAVDEPLVEIEAEKTTDDVLAPVAGTILEILVAEGETVPALTVLALIGEPGEAVASPAPASSPPKVQITPVARRAAKELGVDLAAVTGTGPGGRITEYDVHSHATDTPSDAVGDRASSPTATVPLTGMRKAIASRMHDSIQSMAQLTLTRQMDATELIGLQQSLKAEGTGVAVTDLVLKAVAIALNRHPALNATLEDDVITLHAQVDLGVAVALEDGLIVPVVRDAAARRLPELSAEVRDLAEKVRTNSAKPTEVSGSTFTVTNLGAYGIDEFTPIINPPEVAILGVGRATEVPTRDGNDVAWRQMITFSLTIDHRAVDGVPAALFLQTLAEIIADPAALDD
ncbi:dihydrolipoamide acetyltransferase family protein [Candidatus Poriferisocius sp.]|uniref:dihydrolipoamide acetyltransferase family protein n=1 Tax=Candidatus Poriferisocius sp. TaxID=3101276 RepID=UPI003B528F7F